MKYSNILGFSLQASQKSAHETHHKTIAYDERGKATHVIFKKNKHPGTLGGQASELEASFTAIANLLLSPKHVLEQQVVTNAKDEIVGVTSENAAHALLRLHQQQPSLTFLKSPKIPSAKKLISVTDFNAWLKGHQPISADDAEEKNDQTYQARLDAYEEERARLGEPLELEWDILKPECMRHAEENIEQEIQISAFRAGKGFNFLDKLPHNFFERLLGAKQDGKVDIDMDSLADVFTTGYGLEEDDLHKGNIGYYVTHGEHNIPQFHFFKIDHDLMFSDKIMATRDQRFANQFYTSKEFRITQRDLLGFPDLQDSGNHYWPTKRAILAKGDKAYDDNNDRNAYKSLKDDPDFQYAKWMRFLKQVVIPNDLMRQCLARPLENAPTDPEVANTLAMVQRAAASRMSELRIQLIQCPEFKAFFAKNRAAVDATIKSELCEHARRIGCSNDEIALYDKRIQFSLNWINVAGSILNEKTTIHAAVLTQSYRCHETPYYYQNSINNKDSSGKTALDYAIIQYEECYKKVQDKTNPVSERAHFKSLQIYYADVICDLVRAKAVSTLDNAKDVINAAQRKNSLTHLPEVTSLENYKNFLQNIRRDSNNTLKQDKVQALELLKRAKLCKEDLLELKKELEPIEPEAPLKFIKELRSDIWLVKKYRGAYGSSSTYREMKHYINNKIEELSAKDEAQDEDEDIFQMTNLFRNS